MNNLKVFKNSEFGELNILIKDGKEMFPASECAKMLGYKKPHEAIRLHCKGVLKIPTPSNGGIQKKNFIPESDLYRLIVKSKLPSAEKFEKWVFEDILPSIRKHGGYLTPEKIEEVLLNPDTIIKLATNLKDEQEQRKKLEIEVADLQKTKGQISRRREARAMNLASQMAKKINKLTDNEKKPGEYTAEEAAIKTGIYSKNNKPHSHLVSAFANTLSNKEQFTRNYKMMIATGQIIDGIYYNELFIEELINYLNENKNDIFNYNGKKYKFFRR